MTGVVHYGFMAAHRESMGHLIDSHIYGAELSLFNQTNGKEEWQQVYKNPRYGLSVMYINLPADTILGKAFSLFPYLDFPVLLSRRYCLSLRGGIGLGYLTKHFDLIENHKNIPIGSAFNATIQFNIQNRIKVSEKLEWLVNLGLTHFSNASFSTPNLGINNFTLSSGFSYLFNSPDTTNSRKLSGFREKWSSEIIFSAGIKEIYPPDGDKYFESTMMFNTIKRISYKSAFGIGADLFYDPVLKVKMERKGIITDNINPVRLGIHGEYQLLISKVAMLFDVGLYLVDPYEEDGVLYNRLGLRYYFSSRFIANLSLMAHYAKAEYAEFGLGYRLTR